MRALISIFLSGAVIAAAQIFAGEPAPKWSPAASPFLERRFAEFAPFEQTSIRMRGAEINVCISKGEADAGRPALIKWLTTAATAVSSYYGMYPVPKVSVVLLLGRGDEIDSGVTYSGKLIRMRVGCGSSKECLASDWTMTHEMFHLGFPEIGDEHLWMEEGEAVYLEPIARARIGDITPEQMWCGMIDGMPNGLPKAGDGGLDRTHTWGRTYWGGTLFWLLADIDIRKKTDNKHSLDDGMRAILKSGGDGRADWSVQRVLELCDKATETHVVSELYAKMAFKPVAVDLDALWRSLGVEKTGKYSVRFDDSAPLAAIRKAISDPKQND
jgi:hypothetical protein